MGKEGVTIRQIVQCDGCERLQPGKPPAVRCWEARVWPNLKTLSLQLGNIAEALGAYETKTGHKPKAIGLHPRNAGLEPEAEALGIPVIYPPGMLVWEVWLFPTDNFGTAKSALQKTEAQIRNQVSQNSGGIKHRPVPKRGRPTVLDHVQRDEILRLSSEGLSIRKIARRLGLSRSTVHRSR